MNVKKGDIFIDARPRFQGTKIKITGTGTSIVTFVILKSGGDAPNKGYKSDSSIRWLRKYYDRCDTHETKIAEHYDI